MMYQEKDHFKLKGFLNKKAFFSVDKQHVWFYQNQSIF
jgi:hypothetical protein